MDPVMNQLLYHMTKSQLEGTPNSPSQQHEPFDPGLTGSTSINPTDEGL